MTSRAGWHDRHLELPCGHCIGCRIDQAADWALRCTHEASQHRHPDGSSNNAFITLTFSDEGLDAREKEDGTHPQSLAVRDWQLFAKKLRKAVGPFRFMMSAEYGEKVGRPHYHALLFGQDFSKDRTLWKIEDGKPSFRSPTLERLWPRGWHDVKPCVPETINYVCRYVQKKLTGEKAREPIERVDTRTGKAVYVIAPFATMSRGGRSKDGQGGIGSTWWKENARDAFPSDFLMHQGRRHRVPKLYLTKLEKESPDTARKVRAKRAKKAQEAATRIDNRHKRLEAREVIKEAEQRLYTRTTDRHID